MCFLARGLWAVLGVSLLIGITGSQSAAQDGKLIDASVVTLQHDTLQRLAKIWPDHKSTLDQVEIKGITYLCKIGSWFALFIDFHMFKVFCRWSANCWTTSAIVLASACSSVTRRGM